MGLGIPPLRIEIMLESNPLKSIMLVQYGDWPYSYIYIYIYICIYIYIYIYGFGPPARKRPGCQLTGCY